MKLSLHSYILVLFMYGFWQPFASAQLSKSVEELLYYEQNAIDRSVNRYKMKHPDIKNQKVEYQPENKQWFNLESAWIPESVLNVAESGINYAEQFPDEFVKTENGAKFYRLFIHPESKKFYSKIIKQYGLTTEHTATSTSSSRTVLVKSLRDPKLVYFVKLSLDITLGGIIRTIPQGEVARSVGTTKYLTQILKNNSSNFSFFPEVLGICPQGFERGGQIIRLIPESLVLNQKHAIPIFALYAKTDSNPQTVLEKMIIKSKTSPADFISSRIIKPFIKEWVHWVVDLDVVMEAHAQNFLMIVDDSGLPTGEFLHRDFGGFNIDMEALKNRGTHFDFPTFTNLATDYHSRYSQKAILSSLNIYFSGGVLFNFAKEIKRLDPDFESPKRYLEDVLYQTLENELENSTGLKFENIKNNIRSLPRMIQKAKSHKYNWPEPSTRSFIQRCKDFLY